MSAEATPAEGPDADLPREDRLAQVVFDCTSLVSSGKALDVRAILAEHTDLRPELDLAIEVLSASSPATGEVPHLEAIGGHRILREIGRGGMGVVYEAVELALGRRVALKVLPLPQFADERLRDRFLREARAAARLHHTRIVPVFEVGEEGGVLFYTMQYIAGRGLDRVLRVLARRARPRTERGGVEEADEAAEEIATLLASAVDAPASGRTYFRSVARIGLEVAGALGHAHREGILHRDVKPSNLILDSQGSAWLADFGLAKSDLEPEALTLSGDIVGTIAYMAPERLSGLADARSDVYALGATLYEMLVLRPAFHDPDRRRLLRKVSEEEPVRPRRINPRVPRDLETIVLMAMARDPAHRYGTAADMEADLDLFLRGEPIRARRAGPVERTARWCRRHPMVSSLAATVVLLLSSLLAVSLVSARHLRERLFESELSNARALRTGGQRGRRFESLAAIGRAAQVQPSAALRAILRDEAIAAVSLADLREVARHAEPLVSNLGAAFDWDLDRYAVLDREHGEVAVRRVIDGAELRRLPGAGDVRSLVAFSPDGRLLAAHCGAEGRNHHLRIWRIEDASVYLDRESGGADIPISFDPRGGQAAIGEPDGTIAAIDLESKTVLPRLRLRASVEILKFSADGRKLVAAPANASTLEIHDLESGRRDLSIEIGAPLRDLAWSPDGRLIATASIATAAQFQLWDARIGEPVGTLEGHLGAVTRVVFSPGGELLASSSWDGTLRLWDPWSRDLLLTTSSPGELSNFSRDGRRLASTWNDVAVWEVASGSERRVLRSLGAPANTGGQGLAIHPGGRLLLTSWALWDLATSREIPLAADLRGDTVNGIFRPGGHELLVERGGGVYLIAFEMATGADGEVLHWGRRHRVPNLAEGSGPFSFDASGRRLIVLEPGYTVVVLDLEDPSAKKRLGSHPGAEQVTLSPDGRWAASGTFNHGQGLKIWDVQASRLVKDLDGAPGARAYFSPRGRWLAAALPGEYRLYEVGEWTLKRTFRREIDIGLPGPTAWSPDGACIAVMITPSEIQILDVETGSSVARLPSSQPRQVQILEFTPDGAMLVVARANATAEVWDLRRIREGLAVVGLDLPGFARSPGGSTAPPRSLRVEPMEESPDNGADRESARAGAGAVEVSGDPVRLLDLSLRLQRRGEWKEAIRLGEEALRLSPASSETMNNLAWALVVGPEETRDPRRAVELGEAAVRSSGENPAFVNTLGVAQYRAGSYRESIETLLRGARAGGTVTAWDGFVIAMALKRLGWSSLAADYFENAVRWMERHPELAKEQSRELQAFRSEAAGVLGAEVGAGAGPAPEGSGSTSRRE